MIYFTFHFKKRQQMLEILNLKWYDVKNYTTDGSGIDHRKYVFFIWKSTVWAVKIRPVTLASFF